MLDLAHLGSRSVVSSSTVLSRPMSLKDLAMSNHVGVAAHMADPHESRTIGVPLQNS